MVAALCVMFRRTYGELYTTVKVCESQLIVRSVVHYHSWGCWWGKMVEVSLRSLFRLL